MDFVHLTGTEEVSNAASRIAGAAQEMTRAAEWFNEAVTRFEGAVERLAEIKVTPEKGKGDAD